MKKLSLQGLLPGILVTVLFLLTSASIHAQVGINTNGNTPDTSAMLDVSSNNRGVLLPRMTTAQRTAIAQPADGLTVYDLSTTSYWYYDNDQWNEIGKADGEITPEDLVNAPDLDFSCLGVLGSAELDFPSGSNVAGGTSNTFTTATGVAVAGNFAYVTERRDTGLIVFDVTTPTNPNQVTYFELGFTDEPADLAIGGQYAYVITDDLLVVDISVPSNPQLVATLVLDGAPTAITVVDNYVYVLDRLSEDLKIISVADPTNPVVVGTVTMGSFFGGDIVVTNQYAYVTAGSGLKIIAINDVFNPAIVGQVNLGGGGDLAVSGNYAYVSSGLNIKIINITDPTAPIEITSFRTAFLEDFTLQGNYIYGVTFEDLRIFDISNPTAPALVDSLPLNEATLITHVGNHVYVITETQRRDDELSIVELACSTTSGPLGLNLLDNTFTLLPDGDNLGNHTATMNVNLANFDLTNGDIIEANFFFGDGAGLTNVGDDLGNHTATTNLDLADFDLTNGGNINGTNFLGTDLTVTTFSAAQGNIGIINPGSESTDQGTSNAAGQGFAVSPWVYTNAIEAQGERGPASTLITIGNDGTYGSDDEIHLVTNGDSQLRVDANGRVGIGRDPTINQLEVNGEASKSTPGFWVGNSDARLKKNMRQLNGEEILQKLLTLQGITFEWDDDKTGYARPLGTQYGFTAQNIQEVFPTLVKTDAQGYLQTAYGTYDAMYVEAFRAQQKQIESQQQRITTQQKLIRDLQQQVARIQEVEATLATLQQQLSSLDHSTTTKK